MAHLPFASAPYVVGNSAPAPAHPTSRPRNRCARSCRTTGSMPNTSTSSSRPRPRRSRSSPASSSICCARRPTMASCGCAGRRASIASTGPSGRIEFLYKCVGRGTNGLAKLKPGDDLNMVGPLGVGFTRTGLEEHRRARARRRPRHHGADLAARRRAASASPRSCARAARIRDGRRPVRQGRRGDQRARHRRHSAVENVETILERLIAEQKPTRSTPAAPTAYCN